MPIQSQGGSGKSPKDTVIRAIDLSLLNSASTMTTDITKKHSVPIIQSPAGHNPTLAIRGMTEMGIADRGVANRGMIGRHTVEKKVQERGMERRGLDSTYKNILIMRMYAILTQESPFNSFLLIRKGLKKHSIMETRDSLKVTSNN